MESAAKSMTQSDTEETQSYTEATLGGTLFSFSVDLCEITKSMTQSDTEVYLLVDLSSALKDLLKHIIHREYSLFSHDPFSRKKRSKSKPASVLCPVRQFNAVCAGVDEDGMCADDAPKTRR